MTHLEDWKESIADNHNPRNAKRPPEPEPCLESQPLYHVEIDHDQIRHDSPSVSQTEIIQDHIESLVGITDEELLKFYQRREISEKIEVTMPHLYNLKKIKGAQKVAKTFKFKDIEAITNVIINAVSAMRHGKVVTYIRRRGATVGNNISTYRVNLAIDHLCELGMIGKRDGVASAVPSLRRPSAWWPTEKLIDILTNEKILIENTTEVIHRESVPVILRNREKKEIPIPRGYEKTIEDMRVINRSNDKFKLELDGKLLATSGTRIFNETMKLGGRVYRNDVLQLSSCDRLKLTVDGDSVVEIDYISEHPRMLFHMVGMDCPVDVYSMIFDGKYTEEDRELVKVAVNVLINSKTRKQAATVLKHEIRESFSTRYTCEQHLLDDVYRGYDGISKFFLSGIGRELQNIDSDIAIGVMMDMAELNKFCVGCHDSFITKMVDKEVLLCIMDDHYRRKMKNHSPMMVNALIGNIKIREVIDNE